MLDIVKNDAGNSPGANSNSSLLRNVKSYVLELFNIKHDARLVFNSYQRTAGVVDFVKTISQSINASTEDAMVAETAAWFHLVGYLFDYNIAQQKSIQTATDFLSGKSCSADLIQKVCYCLEVIESKEVPKEQSARILSDAIHAMHFGNQFFQKGPLLRLEWELINNRKLTSVEWQQIQLQGLLGTRFYTDYGKKQFEPVIGQNILIQKSKVEKSKSNFNPIVEEDGQLRKFQSIEKRQPSSATQTFFRANYRNHINLSAIADNKANIMISVNAILISVLISILTYKDITDTTPMVLLPVVIFLVTGLTSLIFAVLSIRPKVTNKNEAIQSLEEAKKNIVFFGNFVQLDLDQYEEALDSVLRDGELLYGNMARDLYFLGKVLDKKYRYLTMSYNIFMVGFIATVLTFLVTIFS